MFKSINTGYNAVFRPGRMSIGLVAPVENYATSATPTMQHQIARIQLAESLGFSAVWLRDVPFNVPSFGDAGQIYDPFVYLGYLAAQTSTVALGVASIILPLRHPAHIAKAAASVDSLSNGRLILGVASGDRPEEYPALNADYPGRGAQFRACFEYIRKLADDRPHFTSTLGTVGQGIDMLPKPTGSQLPLLVTGGAQQRPDWIAEHSDGWMTYPRNSAHQLELINDWTSRVSQFGRYAKPVMQPLYFDLAADSSEPPQPIHLGFRSGVTHLTHYLKSLEEIGVNHVALNLRFNQADIETTLQRLAEELLPEFNH